MQIGPHAIDRAAWDWRAVEENPFWCPDAAMARFWADYLDGVRKAGSSAGAVIEIVAGGVPAGLGEPVYDKLDGELARALMTINAVKGVEIGAGFAAAALKGEENADEMRMADGRVVFLSNNAGGILGGISTGQDIVARFAVKPTSSILTPMRTVDVDGNEIEIATHGRHDPCVGIRAVPVGEAMVACVLADTCCATARSAPPSERMRRLLLGFFATIGVLAVLLVIAAIVAVVHFTPSTPPLPANIILSVDLTQGFADGPGKAGWLKLIAGAKPSLRDFLDAIEAAGTDPRVKGSSPASATTLSGSPRCSRSATRSPPSAPRASSRSPLPTALASSAAAPAPLPGERVRPDLAAADGQRRLTGLYSDAPFLKGTLDLLGIVPEFDHRGRYKTAANILTETQMTPPDREQVEDLLSSLGGQVVDGIAAGAQVVAAGGARADRPRAAACRRSARGKARRPSRLSRRGDRRGP